MHLRDYVLKGAKEAGICREWADKIAVAENEHALLQLYVKGIDFCLDNNFPSKEDLVSIAGDLINQYGIYVDQKISLVNSDFIVLLGSAEATVEISTFTVSQIFIKDKSRLELNITGNAVVAIDCFDQAEIKINSRGNSFALINLYGSAKISGNKYDKSNIKVVKKHRKGYAE